MTVILLADGMFAGGLLLSATLIGFAAWLHFNERNGWAYEHDSDSESLSTDQRYLKHRRRSRNRVHTLFALCGLLVFAAAIAGPGMIFVAAWSSVAFILMVIMAIAMMDGLRTHVRYRDKLPEIRREIFEGDD